jgi:Zn-dependent protease with chaperone function
MVRTARATLAVALLLAGRWYAYPLAVLAAGGGLVAWLGLWGAAGLAAGAAAAGAAGYATRRVLRVTSQPYGLPVAEPRAPELWAAVRELAAGLGTRPPDEIRLVAEVTAEVRDDGRLLGGADRHRRLYLGLPLLQAFPVAQLRAVLAHELGLHARHRRARLGGPVHRGRQSLRRRLALLPERAALSRWLLREFARLYLAVSAPVCRAQAIEADLAAARLAGRPALVAALRDLPALAAAWRYYLETYLTNGLATGLAPTGVFSYFPTLLAARAGVLATIRAEAPASPRSRWDPHPTDAERIVRLQQVPAGPAAPVDGRPASALVTELDAAMVELEELALGLGDRPRVPYEEYRTAAVQWHEQRAADALYRAAARLAALSGAGAVERAGEVGGGAGAKATDLAPGNSAAASGNLGTVLDLLAAGRRPELAVALLPSIIAAPAVVDALTSAIGAALVGAGAARWQHSWSGPPVLRSAGTTAGTTVDARALATRAVSGEVAAVREELARLGVDPAAATAEPTAAPAAGADVLAGITNAVVDGRRRDLVITSVGLVAIPPLPLPGMEAARRRMRRLLTELPVPALATAPGHRYLPYEELASGTMTRRSPVRFEFVTRTGGRLRIRSGRRSGEVGDGWEALSHLTAMLTAAGAAADHQ